MLIRIADTTDEYVSGELASGSEEEERLKAKDAPSHVSSPWARNENQNLPFVNGTAAFTRKHYFLWFLQYCLFFFSWKYHIAFVCSRISRNIGIISKLRCYLSMQQLKQIYYNLIYPYISYSVVALGSIYKTYKENPSKTKPYSAINILC